LSLPSLHPHNTKGSLHLPPTPEPQPRFPPPSEGVERPHPDLVVSGHT
jgi:hypothetical protein